MFSSREDMREYAAQLYAIIVVCGEPQHRHLEIIRELTANLHSQVSVIGKSGTSWTGYY